MSFELILASLSGAAGFFYFPPIFRRCLGLEKYNSLEKYIIPWVITITLFSTAAILFANPSVLAERRWILSLIAGYLILISFEIAGRIIIIFLSNCFPTKFPEFRITWIDLSCYGDPSETRIQGHPFLQFTGRIGKRAGFQRRGAYGDYGFVGISHQDLPKPSGVFRIACLGESTTEYGYPAFLEAYLNEKFTFPRFQVLNFGLSWWTTIHSVVNWVLNVRDFNPDMVIIHHNVNDHKYRGYSNLRGDGAHAFLPWKYRGAPDRLLIHCSVIYRFLRFRIKTSRRFLLGYGDYPEETDAYSQILQQKGKRLNYSPGELSLFKRNLETIVYLAHWQGSVVILTTMPFSSQGEGELYEAIKNHMVDANNLIREIAAKQTVSLVDLEKMAADEPYFRDMVHMTEEGDRKKASEIGDCVARLLDTSRSARRSEAPRAGSGL